MRLHSPCKDCEARHPHCHSQCPLYLEFRADRDQYNLDVRAMKRAEDEFINYLSEKKHKAVKRRNIRNG